MKGVCLMGLCSGEKITISLPFLYWSSSSLPEGSTQGGSFLKAQRPGAVRLGVWERGGDVNREDNYVGGGQNSLG